MKHTPYRRVIRVNNFIKKYVVSLCCGVVAATPLASWASPRDLHDIEQALRCNDVAKWTQVMRDLGPWADQEVMAGRLVRTPLTQLRFSNEPILDYVFPAPIKLLGQETVGFASAMGMLPGVTVFFNATIAALRQAFERDGYAFQCKTISELKGEACQASRPIPQDMVDPAWGNVELQFVLTITGGEALLPPRCGDGCVHRAASRGQSISIAASRRRRISWHYANANTLTARLPATLLRRSSLVQSAAQP